MNKGVIKIQLFKLTMEQKLYSALQNCRGTLVMNNAVYFDTAKVVQLLNLKHGERLVEMFLDAADIVNVANRKYVSHDGLVKLVKAAQTLPLQACSLGHVAQLFQ